MKRLLFIYLLFFSLNLNAQRYFQNQRAHIANADSFKYTPPVKLIKQVLTNKNDEIKLLMQQARIDYHNNDFDNMIIVADDMLKVIENYSVAYYIKAMAYYHKNEILNAYNFGVLQLEENDETSIDLYNLVSDSYFEYIRENLSEDNFKLVQYICENTWFKDDYVNFFLGVAYYFQDDFVNAKKALIEAKEIHQANFYLDAIKNETKIENPYKN